MRNNKIYFKLMLVGLTFAGCNKYLDVNNDPNRVTDANVTPELIFTQAEVAVGARQASGDFLFLEHWMGYSAQNGGFAPQQNEVSYNIDPSFGNTLFVNHFDVLFDLHQAEVKGLATGDTTLTACSMILESKLWQELVDLYGNIPYSQAFQVNTTTTPGYDNAQDIYNALQLKLDSAVTYLQNTTVSNAFSKADVIATGNTSLWIAFANTMKLRLLIRQSQVSGFDPTADANKIVANGGPLGAGQTIADNPGFVNDVNKQNNFYAAFGWSPTGVVSTGSDNANNYIVSILGGNADPRLGRFFYPVGFSGNTFAGAVYGDNVGNIPTQANLSYFGPGIVGNINGNNQGDGTGAVQNQWIMTSFESMFLTAEAIARGWLPGTAQTAYEAAVTESFVWLGVPDANTAATAYLASPAGSWATNAGVTAASQATFITYQKYLANTMIDPLESYSDLRRLNMLTDDSYISEAPGKISNTLPVRLLYPQSELTTNGTNVNKQGTINAFTSKLFWEP